MYMLQFCGVLVNVLASLVVGVCLGWVLIAAWTVQKVGALRTSAHTHRHTHTHTHANTPNWRTTFASRLTRFDPGQG
eukprot:6456702-Amphidinium_carterae.1